MRKSWLLIIIILMQLTVSRIVYAAGYQPAQGVQPHGGYTISSNKCKICHAVHGTPKGSLHLLPKLVNSPDWGGCEQCHSEASSFAAPTVYSMVGYKGQHSVDGSAIVIPDSSKQLPVIGYNPGLKPAEESLRKYATRVRRWKGGKDTMPLKCLHCHSPHGNNVMGGGKVLRWDPARDGGKAQNLTQFCADCHNKNYVIKSNKASHPLRDPGKKRIAFSSASACTSCHNAAKSSRGGQFPHQSIGASLLKAQYNGTNIDGVCLDCHRSSNGKEGVGRTY